MTNKDTTFCTSKDCGKLDCPRNTNRPGLSAGAYRQNIVVRLQHLPGEEEVKK
jgi:hypothetical protein